MKIAFDVDVLAKQMSINDMVHKVADWGYKYIEQSPHPRINPFYKHPLFSKEAEMEYRQALNQLTQQQRGYAQAGGTSMCEVCASLYCANACCQCMGGGC